MAFSSKTRKKDIQRLANGEELDLLIIGGGITGAGVALQAAAAGMKVGLVEMQDFGGGTSSRSTRLVHGGIRYLKTFDVQVVSDTVKERAVVQHIAPHCTYPDPMILPIYDEPGTTFTMFECKVAMDLYDHLAGINENEHLKQFANYTLTKDEVLKREPQLNANKLVGAGVYLDYQNNDSRLVVENIKAAADKGGIMLSRVKANEILHDEDGTVNGVSAQDMIDGFRFEIKAKVILNAAGPWSDKVKGIDHDLHDAPQMRPTKGVHFVVDQSRLQVPQPTYFGSGTDDGRMIFTIPREGKTYFGTTDTDYKGDYEEPHVEMSDVEYLLGIINKKYPTAHLTIDDIESSWAGLRPLLGAPASEEDEDEPDAVSGASKAPDASAPSAVSRGSSLTMADDGLITLAGGKLTDYRLMAEGAMDMIQDVLDKRFGEQFTLADSTELRVSGGDFDSNHVDEALEAFAKEGEQHGLSHDDALRIAREFGSNAPQVYALADELEAAPGLSLAETITLRYALDNEMVLTPVDYLLRRTYHVLFMRDSLDGLIDPVIAYMKDYLGWSDADEADYREELQEILDESDLKHLKAEAHAGQETSEPADAVSGASKHE